MVSVSKKQPYMVDKSTQVSSIYIAYIFLIVYWSRMGLLGGRDKNDEALLLFWRPAPGVCSQHLEE